MSISIKARWMTSLQAVKRSFFSSLRWSVFSASLVETEQRFRRDPMVSLPRFVKCKVSSYLDDGVASQCLTEQLWFPPLARANSKATLTWRLTPPPSLLLPSPFRRSHPASPVCAYLNFNHLIFNTFHSDSSQSYPIFQRTPHPTLTPL